MRNALRWRAFSLAAVFVLIVILVAVLVLLIVLILVLILVFHVNILRNFLLRFSAFIA